MKNGFSEGVVFGIVVATALWVIGNVFVMMVKSDFRDECTAGRLQIGLSSYECVMKKVEK